MGDSIRRENKIGIKRYNKRKKEKRKSPRLQKITGTKEGRREGKEKKKRTRAKLFVVCSCVGISRWRKKRNEGNLKGLEGLR